VAEGTVPTEAAIRIPSSKEAGQGPPLLCSVDVEPIAASGSAPPGHRPTSRPPNW
jgi:hypothetical protein